MEGTIIEDGDGWTGVGVTDNMGVYHKIAVEPDGNIRGHSQDGYSDDPKRRTDDENEAVNQAARYAKFHVYRERGHDTLEPHENPDRIATLALVVDAMSVETFRRWFGDLYRQVRSHHTDTSPARPLPDGVTPDDVLFYRQEVYLGIDATDLSAVTTAMDGDVVGTGASGEARRGADAGDGGAIDEAVVESLVDEVLSEDVWIEAVSGLHVRWDEGLRQRIDRGDPPDINANREPDVRLEVFPKAYTPESIEEFRDQLGHHLKCQVRDCFVGMGVVPPETFRVRGPGIYQYANWYQHHDVYQPYHDPDADIDWTEV